MTQDYTRDSECWVFEVTENGDLYSHHFITKDGALEYVNATNNKCQILQVEPGIGSSYRVTVEDHT